MYQNVVSIQSNFAIIGLKGYRGTLCFTFIDEEAHLFFLSIYDQLSLVLLRCLPSPSQSSWTPLLSSSLTSGTPGLPWNIIIEITGFSLCNYFLHFSSFSFLHIWWVTDGDGALELNIYFRSFHIKFQTFLFHASELYLFLDQISYFLLS